MSGKKAKKVGGQKALKASSGANAKAKTLSSRIVFKGKVFSVRRDEIIEPSGVRATRDMIATKGRAYFLGERALGHIDPGAKTCEVAIGAVCDAAQA